MKAHDVETVQEEVMTTIHTHNQKAVCIRINKPEVSHSLRLIMEMLKSPAATIKT